MSEYLQFASTVLASDDLSVGRVPFGASLDGRTLIDSFVPIGADYATVYDRGAEPRVYSVQVWRLFSTEAAAVGFALTHVDTVPRQGDLTLVSGSSAWTMADAVAQTRILERRGTAVLLAYTFTGSRFESDDVPESPDDSNTVKAQVVNLSSGDVSKAVTFDTPFASTPRFLLGEVTGPSSGAGGVGIKAFLSGDPAADGCTFEFSQAIPATGTYKLRVFAVL